MSEAMTPETQAREFAPCPLCKQYSHSIGEDKLADALMHFESMYAHPLRGHPMGHNFDEKTRDAAQVLMAAALSSALAEREAVIRFLRRDKSDLEALGDSQRIRGAGDYGAAYYSKVDLLRQCIDAIARGDHLAAPSEDKLPTEAGEG